MVQSNYLTANDLFNTLLFNRPVKESLKHLAFIILENDKIPWTWYKEKMASYLYWNMQGGVTGAGSGHNIYFCKDLDTALEQAKLNGHTHAMVCTIGMVLSGFGNQTTVKTPIQNFYEFSESDEFMRAHIIAHPNKPATIHTQHLEINLAKWNGKSITKLGADYSRSDENIHDDYTPLWIETGQHPTINNFNKEQRSQKWFTYPHRDYEHHENIVYNYIKNNKTVDILENHTSSKIIIDQLTRKRKRFYYENNEALPKDIEGKYDVIIAPTAGLIPEWLYKEYGHRDTEVIIFDYDQVFLDVKQRIIDLGFVGEDLLMYMDHLSTVYSKDEYIFSSSRTPNQMHAFKSNKDITDNAINMIDNLASGKYEMKLVNMLVDDLDWLPSRIAGKRTLCYVSNIFTYYATWLLFDAKHIISQYNNLNKQLSASSEYKLIGRSWR